MDTKVNHRGKNILYILLVAGVIYALFCKCKYGYATLDEAFYPTIGYRFMQGDAVLYEEWNNTQLYGVLFIPILKAYIRIHGNTDGIYLFIRQLYTVLKILLSFWIYFRLRKYGKKQAYVSALLFMIFAAYGLMVISYNTVALGGVTVALLLLLNEEDSIRTRIYCILAGIALSVGVLGIPYMALIYISYFFAVVFIHMKKNNIQNKTIKFYYSFKAFGMVTVGVCVSAFLYCCYVFSCTSLSQILQTIPHILYGDSAHSTKSLYRSTLAYIVRILIGNDHNYVVFVGYALIGMILLFYLLDRNREKRKRNYIIISGVTAILLLGMYVVTDNYINSIIFVPNVLALLLAIMIQDETIKMLFDCIWIPGVLITYCEYLASNTGFSGISAAACVAAIGSIMMIGRAVAIYWDEMKGTAGILAVFVLLTVCICMYYRITYVFSIISS